LRSRDKFSKSLTLPSRKRHCFAANSLARHGANITCTRGQIWSNHKNPALATRCIDRHEPTRAARPLFGRSRMPDTAVQELGISKRDDALISTATSYVGTELTTEAVPLPTPQPAASLPGVNPSGVVPCRCDRPPMASLPVCFRFSTHDRHGCRTATPASRRKLKDLEVEYRVHYRPVQRESGGAHGASTNE
jgi:hypothetical protein